MDIRAPKVKAARVFKDLDIHKAMALVDLYKEAHAPVTITRVADNKYTVRVYVWKETT